MKTIKFTCAKNDLNGDKTRTINFHPVANSGFFKESPDAIISMVVPDDEDSKGFVKDKVYTLTFK